MIIKSEKLKSEVSKSSLKGAETCSLLFKGYFELGLMKPAKLQCVRATLYNLVYILCNAPDQCTGSCYIT